MNRAWGLAASAIAALGLTTAIAVPQAASDPAFTSCDQVYAAGLAPLLIGEPGYSRALDKDGDGVACELPGSPVAGPVRVPPASSTSDPGPSVIAGTQYALPAYYNSAQPVQERPETVEFSRWNVLLNMTWSAWGPDGAVGEGSQSVQTNCDPSCGHATRYAQPIQIRASNPIAPSPSTGCPSEVMFYTDFVITYPSTALPLPMKGPGGYESDGGELINNDGKTAARYSARQPSCDSH